MRYNHFTTLPEQAFKSLGGRMTLEGGGSSSSQPTQSTQYNANIPEYAKPYVTNMLGATQTQLFDMDADKGITGFKPYQPYSSDVNDYFAGFSPMQKQAFGNVAGMQTNAGTGNAMNQTQDAYNRSANAGPYDAQNFGNQYGSGPQFQNKGLGYLSANAPRLNQYGMGPADQVSGNNVNNQNINAAQSNYRPDLQQYQMGPAERIRSQNFGQQSAQDYMSPYAQQAIDPTLRENQRQFDIASTGRQAAAARSGAFGGSRQAIEQSEAQRNLGTLQSNTQAQGMQNAYQNAQQQFNADQARRQQAQMSNQQAGLTVGQQNLGANLQTQALGSGQNLQTAMANLTNQQQANVQNTANNLQAQGMNAEQAMRAALANQQAGLTVGQQNLQSQLQTQALGSGQSMQAQLANQGAYGQMQGLGMQQNLSANQQAMQNAAQQAQYGLAGQQAGEASRQFGANYGLQNRQQALAAAGQLGALGQQQYTQQMGINAAQQAAGAQQQALEQSKINQAIQNYATQQQYPMMQLGMMSNMLRGLPMQSTTTQSYQAAPTMGSQLVGSAGALGSLYQGMNAVPKKEGGVIRGLAGGGSVNGQGYAVGGEIKQQLSAMSEEQLQQVVRTSASNEIRSMAAEILAGKEMAKKMTSQMPSSPGAGQGIAAANTGDMFTSMADGGIIAFAPGGYTDDELKTNQAKLSAEENALPLTSEQMAERMAQPVMAGLPPEKRPNMQPGAGASIEDWAKYLGAIRTDAGIGAPRQAEKEMLDKRMAGRGAEESSQNYFKAAEFFAKMANTPGGLLRSATAAGAEVLPEFAKLQDAQRQVRATDAKIQADITEAGRLDKVGLFDQAAKLRSDAQTLDAHNQRTKDEIAGRLQVATMQGITQKEVAGIQGVTSRDVANIGAGASLGAARIHAGAPSAARTQMQTLADYLEAVTEEKKGQGWTPAKLKVEASRRYEADARGGSGRTDATLAAATGRMYDALLARSKVGTNALQRDINEAKTPAIRDAKIKELADLKAGILDEARRIVYNEDAPSAAPAAAAPNAPAIGGVRPPISSFQR